MQYIEIAHVIDDVLNTSIWAIPVAEGMKMLENDESYKIPTIEFSKSQLGERFISQKELFDMTSKLGKLLSKIPKNMKCVVDQHSINR